MQYRSHRGGVYYTPENTLPAFEQAIRDGYDHIETDPQLTKDGVVVLIHDGTVNRTCRNADGSMIEAPAEVSSLTYEELTRLDAGIAWGEKFRGTRVPRLDELLALAEGKKVSISLDKKIPTADIDVLIDVVEKYHVNVSFSTSDTARIRKIQERLPDAHFDFDVNIDDETLAQVRSLVKYENLIVWLYLDKPNFSWLAHKAKVFPENLELVRKYARLGIANVNTPVDVIEAIKYRPDIVEV